MAIVRLTWQAPSTRESGRALNPADIALYTLEQSYDGGAFTKLTDSPAAATSRDVPNLAPGKYKFRLACLDTKNRSGKPFEGTIDVPDDTPPGMVLNLTLAVISATSTST